MVPVVAGGAIDGKNDGFLYRCTSFVKCNIVELLLCQNFEWYPSVCLGLTVLLLLCLVCITNDKQVWVIVAYFEYLS